MAEWLARFEGYEFNPSHGGRFLCLYDISNSFAVGMLVLYLFIYMYLCNVYRSDCRFKFHLSLIGSGFFNNKNLDLFNALYFLANLLLISALNHS